MISEKLVELIKENDFVVYLNEKNYVEFGTDTPAGENWIISVDCTDDSSFIEELKEYVYYFDVDDEAEFFIECRGEYGVPTSILTLVEDQKWKEEVLNELLSILLNDGKKKVIEFNTEAFMKWLKEEFPEYLKNHWNWDIVENIIDYALEKEELKDRKNFCDFISNIIPKIKSSEVDNFFKECEGK